jgi:hypothetical protein
MDHTQFASALRKYSSLQDALRQHLLELSPKMDSSLREHIIQALEEAAQKENDILEEAMLSLEKIEHQVNREVRVEEEDSQRKEDLSHLPDFDS